MATEPSTAGGFRPDIEGLRAVAVLLVMVFHAGLPLRGGFLGGDVFFVLSGFLITGLLVPRRRLWVKATLTQPVVGGRKVKIEHAGLARGEDPGLERAVEQFRTSHLSAIAEQLPAPLFKKGTP